MVDFKVNKNGGDSADELYKINARDFVTPTQVLLVKHDRAGTPLIPSLCISTIFRIFSWF